VTSFNLIEVKFASPAGSLRTMGFKDADPNISRNGCHSVLQVAEVLNPSRSNKAVNGCDLVVLVT
jgi:hypothetical protein